MTQSEIFHSDVTKETIVRSGEFALASMYGGLPGEGLDSLHYMKFCEKARSRISMVQVHTLLPISVGASEHSKRVYVQVQQWMGRDD